MAKLDDIDSDQVWIYIFKHDQMKDLILKKMQNITAIKTMESERGWDVIVSKEQARAMLS